MARGLDMNGTNNRNETSLMTAVGQGYGESVQLLLQRGARTDIRSNSGRTALLLASEKTNLEVLRALILAGADIYSNDGKGNTALHFAAAKGTADMVRLLLTAGIYVNSANGEGKTPYDMSFQNKDRGGEIRAVLVTAGAIVPQPPAEAAAVPEAPPAETEGTVMAETNLPKAPIQGVAQAKPAPVTAAASKPVIAETAIGAGTAPAAEAPVPAESSPAESPAGPAAAVVSLSWPMINPSKAEGWSNRDKLTGKGRFVYALPGQDNSLFTREYSFPLQGVNIKEGNMDQEFPWDGSSPAVIKMILDTNQGRTLTAEIPLGEENGAGPVRFEKFLYQ